MSKAPERPRVDLEEIERLYRNRFQAFLYTVMAMVGDVEAARDVVQDAFAAAIGRRSSYRGAGTVEAWLWAIVMNAARDHRRGRTPEGGRSLPLDASLNGEVDRDVEAVRAAMAELSERQQQVVFLRYYADLGYAEIAEILGVSPGTVGSTLNGARAQLLVALDDLEEVHR